MTSIFTPDQMREQLRAKNVGEEAIIRALAREFGPATETPAIVATFDSLSFVLPWSALVSDNRKYSPASQSGSRGGKLILRPEYRAAKEKARKIARIAMGSFAPLDRPLSLVARVWVPDNRPGHDVANFAKNLLDALEGVVVVNDALFYRVLMERAGVDIDAPRGEIDVRLWRD